MSLQPVDSMSLCQNKYCFPILKLILPQCSNRHHALHLLYYSCSTSSIRQHFYRNLNQILYVNFNLYWRLYRQTLVYLFESQRRCNCDWECLQCFNNLGYSVHLKDLQLGIEDADDLGLAFVTLYGSILSAVFVCQL